MQSKSLRIAFAGTPEFAAVSLKALIKNDLHELIAVYTQPDKPAGRGRKLKPSAVKELATEHALEVRQPENFKDDTTLEELAALKLDLLIVVAYGQILPESVLNIPRLGCINVHGSLLPRWRGAAPIHRAIEAGDTETGVTIMQVAKGLDSGDMFMRSSCPISLDDTTATLHDKLAKLGAEALLTALQSIASGTAVAEVQDENKVTYAEKVSKQEADIDWNTPAIDIDRKIRAYNPFPVARSILFGKTTRIWKADVIELNHVSSAGEIIQVTKQGIDIATAENVIRIISLQLPGKKVISAADFFNGNPDLVQPGV